MQILIVEDEMKIAQVLQKALSEEHYSTDVAHDGEEALYKFLVNDYDLIILDIMLPIIDGITVCKKIREKNTGIPILMLTAKDAIDDRIRGLDSGADDYLVKPFSFGELSARVRALLRRGNKADPAVLSISDLTLNPATKTVNRGGKDVHLTSREFALLEYFMRHPNTVISKTELLEHVWDFNYEGLSNIIETYIKYLRKKLHTTTTSQQLIHTMRGSGYILKGERG